MELVEFHVWYLKAKGWVERLDTGQLAISALGVDEKDEGVEAVFRYLYWLRMGASQGLKIGIPDWL